MISLRFWRHGKIFIHSLVSVGAAILYPDDPVFGGPVDLPDGIGIVQFYVRLGVVEIGQVSLEVFTFPDPMIKAPEVHSKSIKELGGRAQSGHWITNPLQTYFSHQTATG